MIIKYNLQITACASQVHSQLKTLAKPLVKVHYGLNVEHGKKHNHDKAEQLLDHLAFLYKASQI
jgi:hypothetical protein